MPLSAGVLLSLLALMWLPWERVHPADPLLRETLGYAPFWSHRFAAIPRAHVDWSSYFVSLFVIWVLCVVAVLMLRLSATHD